MEFGQLTRDGQIPAIVYSQSVYGIFAPAPYEATATGIHMEQVYI